MYSDEQKHLLDFERRARQLLLAYGGRSPAYCESIALIAVYALDVNTDAQ